MSWFFVYSECKFLIRYMICSFFPSILWVVFLLLWPLLLVLYLV